MYNYLKKVIFHFSGKVYSDLDDWDVISNPLL